MADNEIFERLKAGENPRFIEDISDYDQEEVIQFIIGFHEDRQSLLISALQCLLEIYDDQSGKAWTTASKRRALDAAHEAVNKAIGG